MNIIFYIASAIAVITTLMAVTRRNAIHALLYVILSFLGISVDLYLIGAPFIAALEVIIYAGAIMVLFIFVVMMLNAGKEKETEKTWQKPYMWIFPLILAVILLIVFIYAFSGMPTERVSGKVIAPKHIGISLFSSYLLGVEIAGMILLLGVVGAYHLGRQKKKTLHRFLIQKKEDADDSAG